MMIMIGSEWRLLENALTTCANYFASNPFAMVCNSSAAPSFAICVRAFRGNNTPSLCLTNLCVIVGTDELRSWSSLEAAGEIGMEIGTFR